MSLEMLSIRTSVLNKLSKSALIIPFVYKTNYVEIRETMSSDWNVDNKNVDRKNILQHVSNLIAVNEEEIKNKTIGQYFELKNHAREKYGFPKNTSQSLYLINEDEEILTSFKINKISLYLFETQIGFLLYDVIHQSDNLEEIVLTNYHLKHLDHLFHSFLYDQAEYFNIFTQRKKSLQYLSKDTRTLSEKADYLLKDLQVETYFTNSKKGPATAIVYNFILLDKMFQSESDWEKKVSTALFKLRKGYKNSYQPAPIEYDIQRNPEIIQLFNNSYWAVSLEGLSNLVYLTTNETTNEFFKSNYVGNLEESYFYIYMLALHQRYALLELNSQASQIKKGEDQWGIDEESSRTTISKLRRDINFFILRDFFKHVSSVTHQQTLYEVIAMNLSIEELKNDLHFELEALSAIAELESAKLQKEREKEEAERKERMLEEARRREKEEELRYRQDKEDQRTRDKEQNELREKNADRFLLISTIFVVISTITSSWGILTDFFIKSKLPPAPIPAPYVLLFLSAILTGLGIWAYKYIIAKWKTDSEE